MARSILIADDDPATLSSLSDFVVREGHQPLVAHGGVEAVSLAFRPDIVLDLSILDVNMPDLDGIEAYRRIREARDMLPCIFVTADASKEVRMRALQAGAYTIVPKPVQLELLRYAIREVLSETFRNFGRR